MGGASILNIALRLELLEALCASVVDILGVRDKLGRRGRSIGGRHFNVEDGLIVLEATANAVVGSSCQTYSFMVFSSPPLGFICLLTGQTPDLLLPL